MSHFSRIIIYLLLLIINVFNIKSDEELTKMEASAILSSTHGLSVSIKINEAHDAIELDMTGPSDVYYAIGFGNNVMVDTWTIVVNGDGDDGWFEQMLSNHRPGLTRSQKTFEMITNTFTSQNNLRRLHIKKSLTSIRDYHPFSVDNDKLDIIWAIGASEDFTEHIVHGTQTLTYSFDGAELPPKPR